MVRLLEKISGILAIVAALLLLFITFSIGYSIFTRSLGLHTPVWVVQFNEYSLLWLTFLGTAWVLSRKNHVSIHLVYSRLGAKAQRIMTLIHSLLGVGLCGALCWFGAGTTWEHFQRGVIDVQPVDVPKAFILVVIPIGFFLLTLHFLKDFCFTLKEFKSPGNDKDREASDEAPAGSAHPERGGH